jgi:DNA-binding MarR family transcriptional regulator
MPPQAAVLRGVADADRISIRALARLLGGDPMNVKRWVDEAERRGLLVSGSAEGDRRPRVLTLTEYGRAPVGKVDRLAWAQDVRPAEALGASARPDFEKALSALEAAHGIAQAGRRGDDGSQHR